MAATAPSNALALLPGAKSGEATLEGLKTHRPHIPRRTLDISGSIVNELQQSLTTQTIRDALNVQPTLAGSLDVLPPEAYLDQPVSSCNTRFVHALVNKSRTTINAIVWLPGGRRVYTGAHTGEFTLWGGSSFAFETNMQAHESPVRALKFSHNGLWLLSGDETGAVKCWKPQLELMAQNKQHSEAVLDISFAPTDLKYTSASRDSTIKVWDFPTSAVEQSMTGHGGDVNAADWHPHHALVASGSKDGLVKMWDVKSGKAVATLHGHKSSVTTASWNGNGRWLLSGSRDHTCKVWDLRNAQRELQTCVGHGRDVLTAAWHPVHEELFASGAANGSLLYWLVGQSSSQGEVHGAHEASITAMAWHPEGHVLCTGSSDHMLRFWARRRPGDGVDKFQAAMRRQEAGEGDAPKSTIVPTVVVSAGGIPGIGAPTSIMHTPAIDATALAKPVASRQPTVPMPAAAAPAAASRLQWHSRPETPVSASTGMPVKAGVKRQHDGTAIGQDMSSKSHTAQPPSHPALPSEAYTPGWPRGASQFASQGIPQQPHLGQNYGRPQTDPRITGRKSFQDRGTGRQ